MNTQQQQQDNTNAETKQKSNDWSKREIGALWKREGKSGKYLSGYFKDELGEQVEIVVFSNKFKGENAKAPDFRVYLSKEITPTQATVKIPAKTVAVPVAKAKVKQAEEVEEDLL